MNSLLIEDLARDTYRSRLQEADARRLASRAATGRDGTGHDQWVGSVRRAAGRALISFGARLAGVAVPAIDRPQPIRHTLPRALEAPGRCEHCLW